MVVVLRTRIARLVIVLAAGLLPRFVEEFVAVAAVVEKVARRQVHVIAPAPRIAVIDPHRLYGRDAVHRPDQEASYAASAAAAHSAAFGRAAPGIDHTENILEGEVLLVQVVGQSDDGDAAVPLENIHVASGRIVGRIAVSGIELTELSATLPFGGDDVQRLVALAVVESRELRLIAQLVEYLHALDHFGRQVLDRGAHVVAEKLLAVHKDLLDLFALRLHRTVGGDHDTRHLGQQALGIGIHGHLEGRGVVHHRIALLRSAHGGSFQHHGIDPVVGKPQSDLTEFHLRRIHLHPLLQFGVTEKRHPHGVFAVGHRADCEPTVHPAHRVFRQTAADCEHLHDRSRQRFAVGRIHDRSRNAPRGGGIRLYRPQQRP